jgi:hypothetical protein
VVYLHPTWLGHGFGVAPAGRIPDGARRREAGHHGQAAPAGCHHHAVVVQVGTVAGCCPQEELERPVGQNPFLVPAEPHGKRNRQRPALIQLPPVEQNGNFRSGPEHVIPGGPLSFIGVLLALSHGSRPTGRGDKFAETARPL